MAAKPKRRYRSALPVSAVVLGIVYIYFTTVFIFIEKWFGLMTSPGVMNAIVFTALAIMCIFNYARAIFTDPGRVPSTYMPDVEDSENPVQEIKRKVQSTCCFNIYIYIYMPVCVWIKLFWVCFLSLIP